MDCFGKGLELNLNFILHTDNNKLSAKNYSLAKFVFVVLKACLIPLSLRYALI